MKKSTWAEVPHKFEAGTPNIAGGIAMGSSNLTATASATTTTEVSSAAVLAAPSGAVQVWALSGNFVELPGNDQFALEEASTTLAFENIVIVPSNETTLIISPPPW